MFKQKRKSQCNAKNKQFLRQTMLHSKNLKIGVKNPIFKFHNMNAQVDSKVTLHP